MDDSRVSPRGEKFQLSTDFTSQDRKKKKTEFFGGYDTEAPAQQDNLKFNSTYDDGFANMFDSTDGARSHHPKFLRDFDLNIKHSHLKKTLQQK